jgi:hypothetical protein
LRALAPMTLPALAAFRSLALVEVQIVPDSLLDGADPAGYPDAKLVLRAPGMPELQVPLTADATAGKALAPVTVWGWSGQAAGG